MGRDKEGEVIVGCRRGDVKAVGECGGGAVPKMHQMTTCQRRSGKIN